MAFTDELNHMYFVAVDSERWQSNPFRERICHVFSTSDRKDGSLSFEDFLDLLSAFSDSATLEIKSHYAFRIFGNINSRRC